MSKSAKQKTSSQQVYEDLKAALAGGNFILGSRLRAERIKEKYNCSASTVREAFLRLACEGHLQAIEQKGFRVPLASLKVRNELISMRVLLEKEGAKISIENGDLDWESEVTANYHKLNLIEKRILKEGKVKPYLSRWNQAEYDFHWSIISACNSDILISTHKNIYERFRQNLLGDDMNFGFTKDIFKDHKDIMETALDRDYPRCAKAIEHNIDKDLTRRSKEQYLSSVNA